MKIEAKLGLEDYKRLEEFLKSEENTYRSDTGMLDTYRVRPVESTGYKVKITDMIVGGFHEDGDPVLEVKVELAEYDERCDLAKEQLHKLVDLLYCKI